MEFLMQPIGRSAVLEEVGESLMPAPVVVNGGLLAYQTEPEPAALEPAVSVQERMVKTERRRSCRARGSTPLRRLNCQLGR